MFLFWRGYCCHRVLEGYCCHCVLEGYCCHCVLEEYCCHCVLEGYCCHCVLEGVLLSLCSGGGTVVTWYCCHWASSHYCQGFVVRLTEHESIALSFAVFLLGSFVCVVKPNCKHILQQMFAV